jgi:PAS domain S-box-containing protein
MIPDPLSRQFSERLPLLERSLVWQLLEALPQAAALLDQDLRYIKVNQQWCHTMGVTPEDLRGKTYDQLVPGTNTQQWRSQFQASMMKAGSTVCWYELFSYPHMAQPHKMKWQAQPWYLPDETAQFALTEPASTAAPAGLLVLVEPYDVIDTSLNHRGSYDVQRDRQSLFSAISARIHQSLNLDEILQTAVDEIRYAIGGDRTLIYQFHLPNWNGSIAVESVDHPSLAITRADIYDPCFQKDYVELYQDGHIHIIENLQESGLMPCYIDFLEQFQVKANVAVPIIRNHELWGLLCVHMCRQPRQWIADDIELLRQMAIHVGIALQQATMREQLQSQLTTQQVALRASEHRLSLLVEQTPLMVLELDCKFNVTAWNPACTEIFGYTAAEAIGKGLLDLIVPQPIQAEVEQAMQLALQHRIRVHSFNANRTKDGRMIICEWYDTPLVDEDDQVIGMASMAIDVTERKKAEQALQRSETELRQKAEQLEEAIEKLQNTQAQLIQTEKMSSLGLLVAGIAHEINNPVSFIYGNLTHANRYAQDLLYLLKLYQVHYPHPAADIQVAAENVDLDFLMQDFPNTLMSMKSGTERIQQIVEGLRKFSRVDESDMKPVDIHEGLDSTLMILQHRLNGDETTHPITVIRDYGVLPMVECYAGQLNQVFINLLSNAIDALEEAASRLDPAERDTFSKTIHIKTRPFASEWIKIEISDNGTGVSEVTRNHLFDPFFTTKDPGKGTGLGLSISYQIITERHRGRLYNQPKASQGAVFVIEIPIHQSLIQ